MTDDISTLSTRFLLHYTFSDILRREWQKIFHFCLSGTFKCTQSIEIICENPVGIGFALISESIWSAVEINN